MWIWSKNKVYDSIINEMLAEEDRKAEFIYEKNAVATMSPQEYVIHRFKKDTLKARAKDGSPYVKLWRKIDRNGKTMFVILQGSACILTISLIGMCCSEWWLYVFYISFTMFVISLIGFLFFKYERRNH